MTTKKKTIKKESPKKQYTIFYTIGAGEKSYVAKGTDYKVSALDIKSSTTGEIFSFPVVYIYDEKDDVMEIIPMNSVGSIRYNWGFKEELAKYAVIAESLKEEDGELHIDAAIKNKKNSLDVQYG